MKCKFSEMNLKWRYIRFFASCFTKIFKPAILHRTKNDDTMGEGETCDRSRQVVAPFRTLLPLASLCFGTFEHSAPTEPATGMSVQLLGQPIGASPRKRPPLAPSPAGAAANNSPAGFAISSNMNAKLPVSTQLQDQVDEDDDDLAGFNAFVAAAELGDAARVSEMLRSGADANWPDNEGWPAIVAAAEEGHTLVLKVLLKHKGILVNLTYVLRKRMKTETRERKKTSRLALLFLVLLSPVLRRGIALSDAQEPRQRDRAHEGRTRRPHGGSRRAFEGTWNRRQC